MGWAVLLLALVVADSPADKPKDAKAEPSKKAADSPKPEAKDSDTPKPKRVIDRSYVPAVGDRAVLYAEDEKGEPLFLWASATPGGFKEYIKALGVEDEKRTEELEKQGTAIEMDDETPVVVLGIETIVAPVNAQQFVSETAASVRVLDGPNKGKVLLTPLELVTRLKTAADAPKGKRSAARKKAQKPKAADATVKPVDRAARAASQLRAAQNLEKAGKSAGALEFYRKIVKDYPGTPQAKTAAARIEALGGK